MSPIILQPANPLDLTPDQLRPLAERLEKLGDGQDVTITGEPPRGYGVTWWEVLLIYLGTKTADALINAVVSTAVQWAKERVTDHKRPKYIGIYGADGKVIKSVEVDTEGHETDVTERDRSRDRPVPPELNS